MGNGFSTDFGFSHCYSSLFEWPYSFSFLKKKNKLLTTLTCTNEVTWSQLSDRVEHYGSLLTFEFYFAKAKTFCKRSYI